MRTTRPRLSDSVTIGVKYDDRTAFGSIVDDEIDRFAHSVADLHRGVVDDLVGAEGTDRLGAAGAGGGDDGGSGPLSELDREAAHAAAGAVDEDPLP